MLLCIISLFICSVFYYIQSHNPLVTITLTLLIIATLKEKNHFLKLTKQNNNKQLKSSYELKSKSLLKTYSTINLSLESTEVFALNHLNLYSPNNFTRESFKDDKSIVIIDYLKDTFGQIGFGNMLRLIFLEKISDTLINIASYSNLTNLETYLSNENINLIGYIDKVISFSKIDYSHLKESNPLFLIADNIEEQIESNKKKINRSLSSTQANKSENKLFEIKERSDDENRRNSQDNVLNNESKNFKKEENNINKNKNDKPEALASQKPLSDEEILYLDINNKAKKYFYENYLNKKWVPYVDDKKSGLIGLYFDDEKDRRAIKAYIDINKPIKDVFEYLKNLDNKVKYDSSYEKGKVQKVLNDNMSLLHIQYKGKILFSPRDFFVCINSKLENEKAELFACSYPSDESTHVKKVVRGSVIFNYYILTKLSETKTHVDFFVLSETGLSQNLVNLVLKDIIYTLKEVKVILEKTK